jgi:hypothetical protein
MELLMFFPIKGYALSFDFSRVVNYAHPSYKSNHRKVL